MMDDGLGDMLTIVAGGGMEDRIEWIFFLCNIPGFSFLFFYIIFAALS
jgi:uncharacterized protein YybS (DUF2232 family)